VTVTVPFADFEICWKPFSDLTGPLKVVVAMFISCRGQCQPRDCDCQDLTVIPYALITDNFYRHKKKGPYGPFLSLQEAYAP